MSNFDFGEGIRRLKAGEKVRRAGWNGKGMWLFLVTPGHGPNDAHLSLPVEHEAALVRQRPVICMKDAQGCVTIGWNASQVDMLAEDWQLATETR